MKPVVLLVGRLPDVIGRLAHDLEDLPVEWLGAHDRAEVAQQLKAEPGIVAVIMGGVYDDSLRGELVHEIASLRPDVTIHMKDRVSGPGGMAGFVRKVVNGIVQGTES